MNTDPTRNIDTTTALLFAPSCQYLATLAHFTRSDRSIQTIRSLFVWNFHQLGLTEAEQITKETFCRSNYANVAIWQRPRINIGQFEAAGKRLAISQWVGFVSHSNERVSRPWADCWWSHFIKSNLKLWYSLDIHGTSRGRVGVIRTFRNKNFSCKTFHEE